MRAAVLAVVCKLLVLVVVGLLLWRWTAPGRRHAALTLTPPSGDRRAYERVLKSALHLQSELKQQKHTEKKKNVIRTGEPVHGDSNIYFVEASCLANKPGRQALTQRQACSVESAAKMNPSSEVYLVHSCPIKYDKSKTIKHLVAYRNVRFWNFDMKHLVSGTPLEKWDYESAFRNPSWSQDHSSDVIRFLLLWKYGGTCLDLDIVVIKSMEILEPNFVCEDWNDLLSSNVLRVDYQRVGQLISNLLILNIATDLRENVVLSRNGSELVTSTFKDTCGVDRVSLMTPDACLGVVIHSRKLFFPVPPWRWDRFFNTSETNSVMWGVKDSFGVKMWGRQSHAGKVKTATRQAYGLLAEKFCPRIYSHSGPTF
ncbi:lactosylceramide 4-alpha-galactosyltransferase-like [Periplaneta americana]|uniref:lactosylceramide 4-alpha-galactosyltransferase-like n=1 Tax=Periplaneta americana TaxID=6978 RepID=UPI0037E7CCFA